VMRGKVLEIDCDDAERVVQVLRRGVELGELLAEEVALYGARVHVVVADEGSARPVMSTLLRKANIMVRAIDGIPPSLEDVFISSVREHNSKGTLA